MISFIGAFATNRQTLRWCALLPICFGAVGSADAAIEIVGETHTTFAWEPSTGDVAGYDVYVSRNAEPANFYSTVSDRSSETIHGASGDTIRVSTAAFDASGNSGPRSDPSEEVHFVEATPTTPIPTATATPVATQTPLPTPTLSPTPTPSPTPTQTPEPIQTPLPTPTPSPSASPSATPTVTSAPSVTPTATPAATPSPTPEMETPPADEPPASDDPDPNAEKAAAFDFNGDGHSDILFQNANTGELEYWEMNGPTVVGVIALPSIGPDWRAVGAGDFDSDGITDIVWVDDASGSARVWLMGDDSGSGEFDLRLKSGWVVSGTGDFNGDGRSEIAISNQGSRLEIWGLNRKLVRLARISVRQHWEVVGFGDIDGDGDDDFVFQNRRKQKIEASLMSADFSSRRASIEGLPGVRWNIIDAGDFNGDGQSDLLWRGFSWSAAGDAGVLHLSGNSKFRSQPSDLDLEATQIVAGSADYDGDGITDLLVFDPETRDLDLWLMDGDGARAIESLGTVTPDWHPVGFNTNDTAIH
ncbi:MAG: VCBS repeat-containing protein [Deltaproteobacteria bacterium]|nr:VCBS repeat-containing protein [Deltaproteobacteria bacterium]